MSWIFGARRVGYSENSQLGIGEESLVPIGDKEKGEESV